MAPRWSTSTAERRRIHAKWRDSRDDANASRHGSFGLNGAFFSASRFGIINGFYPGSRHREELPGGRLAVAISARNPRRGHIRGPVRERGGRGLHRPGGQPVEGWSSRWNGHRGALSELPRWSVQRRRGHQGRAGPHGAVELQVLGAVNRCLPEPECGGQPCEAGIASVPRSLISAERPDRLTSDLYGRVRSPRIRDPSHLRHARCSNVTSAYLRC